MRATVPPPPALTRVRMHAKKTTEEEDTPMYLPPAFVERNAERLQDLIEQEAFGALVVTRGGAAPEITHVPLLLDRGRGPHGTLRGHVARANPIWRAFEERLPTVVIFQGPHTYVSPQWYRSRQKVPTWNYAVVHAHGVSRLMPGKEDLRRFLTDLAAHHEEGDSKWTPEELDPGEMQELLEEIVGFEVEITDLRGKFKLSQNCEEPDRLRVVEALRRRARSADVGVARLMGDA